jgi:PIN domain nuclease of toxin-antitoxin system
VILLDTNAVIWLERRHPRGRPLRRSGQRLFLSPATLLELQILQDSGRIRLSGAAIDAIAHDDRWVLDEPPSAAWLLRAVDIGWTRDPFDRLLAAHAQLRGWRLATADQRMLQHLGPGGALEL